MKISKPTFFVFLFSLTVVIMGCAVLKKRDKSRLYVKESITCEGIEHRQPVNSKNIFPSSVGKVFFWTNIGGVKRPTRIKHVWYYNKNKVSEVSLSVDYSSHSAWSYRDINPDQTGYWHVEVVDKNEGVLDKFRFIISTKGRLRTGNYDLKQFLFLKNSRADKVLIDDINSDGLDDIIASSSGFFGKGYERQVSIFLKKKDRRITQYANQTLRVPKSSGGGLDIGDLDSDGDKDIISGSSIFYQKDNNMFSPDPDKTLLSFVVTLVAIGDINNDNMNDIVCCGVNHKDAVLIIQDEEHVLIDDGRIFVGTGIFDIDIADVNNDNLNDILFLNRSKKQIMIYLQKEDNILPSIPDQSLITGKTPYSIDVCDLNGDQLNDIIVAEYSERRLSIFHQTSSNSFKNNAESHLSIRNTPRYVVAGDLRKKGLNDILALDLVSDLCYVFYQDESYCFSQKADLKIDTLIGPHSVAFGDLNSDGMNDMVITNFGKQLKHVSGICIYYNKSEK